MRRTAVRVTTATIAFAAIAASAQALPAPVTFSSIPSEQSYVVPAGVTLVQVDAIGGAGGNGCQGPLTAPTAGGRGAEVKANLAVAAGSILFVEVASNGSDGDVSDVCGPAGGFNGGNGGGHGGAVGGGGGGGASDVRTVPVSVPDSLSTRLIVAAGGGGGGANQGAGGDAGAAGAAGGGGPGGGAGLLTGGGTGGLGCAASGGNGAFGLGGVGAGVSPGDGGGGGGAGWFGGGGGAACNGQTAAGGGGGSSYYAPSVTSPVGPAPSSAAPSVTITPIDPPALAVGAAGATGATGAAGQAGTPGAPGPQGRRGKAGAVGPAGRVELVTCTTVTVTVKHKHVKRKKCTTKLVNGPVDFTTTRSATLSRHGITFARGRTRAGTLVLTATRAIPHGHYTLTLVSTHGVHRRVVVGL